jgi:hypothetical protein
MYYVYESYSAVKQEACVWPFSSLVVYLSFLGIPIGKDAGVFRNQRIHNTNPRPPLSWIEQNDLPSHKYDLGILILNEFWTCHLTEVGQQQEKHRPSSECHRKHTSSTRNSSTPGSHV